MVRGTINQLYVRSTLLLLFLLAQQSLSAQKVAVVLSGGGAKGAAHIGVLRALEENQIPIDFIGGTSMGAIVAGMYAAGYSPDEMEEIILSDDFRKWRSGDPGYNNRYLFSHDDPAPVWTSLPILVDSNSTRAVFPTSIVSPHLMDYAFLSLFSGAGAAAGYDFDSLMVPFRCVSSDIAENRALIHRKGRLEEAVRASMTYPFYFRPIQVDGKLLFDGGMYNNFPADIIYEDFFPDVIIGSNVSGNSPPPRPDDIMSQIESMLMTNTNYDVICQGGVMIRPVLPQITIIDFGKSRVMIDSGYTAAVREIDNIRLFVTDSVSQDERRLMRERFRSRIPDPRVSAVEIEGLKPRQEIYLRKLLTHQSDDISLKRLERDYYRLPEEGSFGYIYPRMKYHGTDTGYVLQLKVQKSKPLKVYFGGNVSSGPTNEAFFKASYQVLQARRYRISGNLYLGRFYNSLNMQARVDFPTLPFYLRYSNTLQQWNYFLTTTTFFEDNRPSYLILTDRHIRIAAGMPIFRQGRLEAGYVIANLKDQYYLTNVFLKEDQTDVSIFRFNRYYIDYELDLLNRQAYPSDGDALRITISIVDGEEEYTPGSTSSLQGFTENDFTYFGLRASWVTFPYHEGKYSLGLRLDGRLSNQKMAGNYVASLLSIPAYEPFQQSKALFLPGLRAYNYISLGLLNSLALSENLDLFLQAELFLPHKEIQRQGDIAVTGKAFINPRLLVSAGPVYHSQIGPISLIMSYYQGADDNLVLSLDIGNILFNRRAEE